MYDLIFIILKKVLREEDFTMLINEISYEIDILDGKINTISIEKILDRIGFPTNYKEIARLDKRGY